MSQTISLGAGAEPGTPCDERVLLHGVETGGALALTMLAVAPYSPAPARPGQAEAAAYYVVSGTLAATVGERTMVVRAGEAVFVAPWDICACWNPAAAPAMLLLITAPAAGVAEGVPALHETR